MLQDTQLKSSNKFVGNKMYYKHETAIVDEGAEIGEGSRIWHWVHISAKAKIGRGCSFGQGVFVGNNVVIGNNCKVQNNVSIYDNVFLEDDVFCGPSMVFTNVINPRAAVVRKDEYKDTVVKRGVTIGANATIVCGVTLGEYCFIAAGAVVTKDVKPFALMAGVPAKQIGWMDIKGNKIPLPIDGSGIWCETIDAGTYILAAGRMSLNI
jgi:UDP-2-acetamido-3-amino-2,3-dideoxy-glucuronate N-acetyltransferase